MAARQIAKTDIQFSDEKLRRLMAHVNRLTEEMQKLQAVLDEGREGQVLVKLSGRDYDATWGSAGGAGEVNTGANTGAGAGIFRDKTGAQLNFRSLVGGSGISISVDGDEITIQATDTDESVEPLVFAGAF